MDIQHYHMDLKIQINIINMSKDEIINKIYYDLGGFGSMKTTLEDAHKYDKTITLNDVKAWFNKNVEKKQNKEE